MFKRCLLILVMALLAMPSFGALQDPTRPPTAAAAAVRAPTPGTTNPRWVLSSTLVSPQRRTAVINGRLLAVGEHIDGARVTDIQADSVRLRVDGREVSLMMLGTTVKQPTKHKRSETP